MMDIEFQKLRGGYYTPEAIASFMSEWSIRSKDDSVLEPSCGDGIFLEAAHDRLVTLGLNTRNVGKNIRAVELHKAEAELAMNRLPQSRLKESIVIGDFFDFAQSHPSPFDVVLGNPPFLRYHTFPEDQRQRAFAIMRQAGLRPSRLTNAWVSFVVASTLMLKDGGRLAMVVPAELLQVNYASQLRSFLAKSFQRLTIVTFRRLVFPGIQQEVMLLLAEKESSRAHGIDVIELEDSSELHESGPMLLEKRKLKILDHAEEKWTQYYLNHDEIELLRSARKNPNLRKMGDLAAVDVGLVTGNNSFFVLNEEQVRKFGLARWVVPIVGRTAQLSGMTFYTEDWNSARGNKISCYLLDVPDMDVSKLPAAIRRYIGYGEQAKFHEGYKCGIRKNWYVVPSRWIPDGFMFRQIHEYPKIVLNEAGAECTDTIHRVKFKRGVDAKQVATCFLNSLTFAFSEVMGRSYGGGVLELEPNEADALPIPYFGDTGFDISILDGLERAGDINTILDITDRVLLSEQLGFSRDDIEMFRGIWRKLSGRRIGRKQKRIKHTLAI